MYCNHCGAQVPDTARHCTQCGKLLSAASGSSQTGGPVINVVNQNAATAAVNGFGYPSKQKWTAFWLCLFLGPLGIHRFYLGKWFTGIVYFFSLGLVGIGWMLDLIRILCNGLRDRYGMPLI